VARLRFSGTPSKTRNYLSRKEQYRVLWLVAALGLVVMLMFRAADPATWHWLTQIDQPRSSDQGKEVDTRLQAPSGGEKVHGSFESPAVREPHASQSAKTKTGSYFEGVRPKLLEKVRDDAIFLSTEHEAWVHLLAILQKSDNERLQQASVGKVMFAQLYNQSEQYRGKLVSTAGYVRRAHRLPAPKNDLGIESYYQVWFQPFDNLSNPMVVYAISLPKGFPSGMDLKEEASLTGFYFKRWAYPASDTVRTVPTILAKTVQWQPAQPIRPAQPLSAKGFMIATLIAATLSTLLAVGLYRQTRRTRPIRFHVGPSDSLPERISIITDEAPRPDSPADGAKKE
jgi:hypothetical protein